MNIGRIKQSNKLAAKNILFKRNKETVQIQKKEKNGRK
jgi:hypothetical protein